MPRSAPQRPVLLPPLPGVPGAAAPNRAAQHPILLTLESPCPPSPEAGLVKTCECSWAGWGGWPQTAQMGRN